MFFTCFIEDNDIFFIVMNRIDPYFSYNRTKELFRCVVSSQHSPIKDYINAQSKKRPFAGFLKTGTKGSAQGNFGLMDLVAGLHWLKENLPAFGGDPQRVTLMGHGTGAALVNFIAVSPAAKGKLNKFQFPLILNYFANVEQLLSAL